MASPNINLAVPFFMVNNMETSLKFYVNKLGFVITKQWTPHGNIEWCWLQRDNVSIMLQEPRNKEVAELNIMNGKGISICFQCADALALYKEFTANGIDIKEPFVGNNMWVVNFSDPDGYKLDFESPTNIPEETTYTQWLQTKK